MVYKTSLCLSRIQVLHRMESASHEPSLIDSIQRMDCLKTRILNTKTQINYRLLLSIVLTVTKENQVKKTISSNLNREPRYDAWAAFQGGYYEVQNNPTNPIYTKSNGQNNTTDSRLICNFLLGNNYNRGTVSQRRLGNYSPDGFFNKQFVNSNTVVASSGDGVT